MFIRDQSLFIVYWYVFRDRVEVYIELESFI